jgi:hypothetical protein
MHDQTGNTSTHIVVAHVSTNFAPNGTGAHSPDECPFKHECTFIRADSFADIGTDKPLDNSSYYFAGNGDKRPNNSSDGLADTSSDYGTNKRPDNSSHCLDDTSSDYGTDKRPHGSSNCFADTGSDHGADKRPDNSTYGFADIDPNHVTNKHSNCLADNGADISSSDCATIKHPNCSPNSNANSCSDISLAHQCPNTSAYNCADSSTDHVIDIRPD